MTDARSGLTLRTATPADIPLLQDLAGQIWRASYASMLAPAQIDYMLEWMYGADTIAAELNRGVCWRIAQLEDQPVGFLALSAGSDQVADLHKLYLQPRVQGAGHGQRLLEAAAALAADLGCSRLRLRVNKNNGKALRAYERAGFVVVDSLVAEIGGGFVMDDFVLERSLETD